MESIENKWFRKGNIKYYHRLTKESLEEALLELFEKRLKPTITHIRKLYQYKYDDFILHGNKEAIYNFAEDVDKEILKELNIK